MYVLKEKNTINENAVAIDAPSAPYSGTNTIFPIIFNTQVIKAMITCHLVFYKS